MHKCPLTKNYIHKNFLSSVAPSFTSIDSTNTRLSASIAELFSKRQCQWHFSALCGRWRRTFTKTPPPFITQSSPRPARLTLLIKSPQTGVRSAQTLTLMDAPEFWVKEDWEHLLANLSVSFCITDQVLPPRWPWLSPRQHPITARHIMLDSAN